MVALIGITIPDAFKSLTVSLISNSSTGLELFLVYYIGKRYYRNYCLVLPTIIVLTPWITEKV